MSTGSDAGTGTRRTLHPQAPVPAPTPASAAEGAQATALLALWNDVVPELDAQYNDWHAVEHVPERLTVPGILWGRRYGRSAAGVSPRYLTLYGLADAAVLGSEPYRRLLREPTPMSRTMRPALVNVSRWVCRLHEQRGAEAGRWLVVRTLAGPAEASQLLESDALVTAPGAVGRLLAERLPDAAPLPWLGGGQGGGIEGDWLVCASFDSDAAAAATTVSGAEAYERLPVG
jgi:hypothetical protein